MVKDSEPKVIVAIDAETIDQAREQVRFLDPHYCHLKIGSVLFTRCGPFIVEELMRQGYRIFLDLKFHDIPQTVLGACRAAVELGVWMINVHVWGGSAMLEAAANALDTVALTKRPLLLGVTVLTSLDQADLKVLGIQEDIGVVVSRMAILAKELGLNGVVCSANEVSILREQCGKDFLLVTPGIRLKTDERDDQKRMMTPEEAIKAGSDYLVIGRPITKSPNPLEVLKTINRSLSLV